MKSLEEHIQDQRSELDNLEPNEGHASRFRAKLDQHLPSPKKDPMRMIWWAAAVVAFILLTTQVVMRTGSGPLLDAPIQEATIGLSDISPEMAEVEAYFVGRIDDKKEQLQTKESRETRPDLLSAELSQLESDYEALKKELTDHDGDERVVRYMVENYRLRLMLLETHLEKIEAVEQRNRLDQKP